MLLNKASLAVSRGIKRGATRRYTNMIAVRKDDICATDGFVLLKVNHQTELQPENFPAIEGLEHATPDGQPILVNADAALEALKALPKKPILPILRTAALGKDGLYTTDLKNQNPRKWGYAIHGQFPSVDAALPKGKLKAVVKLDANKLIPLLQYVKEYCGNGRIAGVIFSVYGGYEAVKLEATTTDGQSVLALIMPIA